MKNRFNLKRLSILMAMAIAFLSIGGAVGLIASGNPASAEAQPTVGYDAIYSSTNPIPEIAANVRPSVVQVVTNAETWNPQSRNVYTEEIGGGSGTYIREDENGGGYILTNNHVISSGDSYSIIWLDGTKMECTLQGADDGTDIAVLHFTEKAPATATPITMGDSDALQIGELAIVIGSPGTNRNVFYNTVTAGIVSGLEREDVSAGNFKRSVSTIQVDAAINSGNSGGALLNSKGELVGIPTLKVMYGYNSVYEGLGFCIPVNAVKEVVTQLIDVGAFVRPRMGVSVQNLDGPDKPLKNAPPAGVQVVNVEKDSPADLAGLKMYDIITEINGIRVTTFNALTAEIDTHKAGDTVELKVYRYYDEKGEKLTKYEELTLTVELEILD